MIFFIIFYTQTGSEYGAAVRALAPHHCSPHSIPLISITGVLSFLRVLVLALRVFIQVFWFSSLHQNKHSKFRFVLETVDRKSYLMECTLLNSHDNFLFPFSWVKSSTFMGSKLLCYHKSSCFLIFFLFFVFFGVSTNKLDHTCRPGLILCDLIVNSQDQCISISYQKVQ